MLQSYFQNISTELQRKSMLIREHFSTHRPTSGVNREGVVADFLAEYLPSRYAISSGLILSKLGEFSNQADIIVADSMSNAPLFPRENEKIWLAESVYSLIEVKTQLTPSTLEDSIKKCQKFKSLPREWAPAFGRQNIKESLFVLWSFEGPSPECIKKNVALLLSDVPHEQRPDFILVPGSTLVTSGNYFEISKLGQKNSQFRNERISELGDDVNKILAPGFDVMELGDNSILAWLVWFTSWLHAAGERRAALDNYISPDPNWGRTV